MSIKSTERYIFNPKIQKGEDVEEIKSRILVRKPDGTIAKKCPECGAIVHIDSTLCSHCGAMLK